MKKLILILLGLSFISACTNSGNSFRYDRKNACEISYGRNGISVIVDQDNILVKNNRAVIGDFVVSLGTANRTYFTLGKYFADRDTKNIIESLTNSETIYLVWTENTGNMISGSGKFRNLINVSDFRQRFNSCVKEQRKL